MLLSKHNPTNDPISTWLQGEPAASSMYGLMIQWGSRIVKYPDQNLKDNDHPLNERATVIFVDNPSRSGCLILQMSIIPETLPEISLHFSRLLDRQPSRMRRERNTHFQAAIACYGCLLSWALRFCFWSCRRVRKGTPRRTAAQVPYYGQSKLGRAEAV